MTSLSSDCTYNEWKSYYAMRGIDEDSLSLPVYAKDRGYLVRKDVNLHNIGDIYKNRKILDVKVIDRKHHSLGKTLAYQIECCHCHRIYWIKLNSWTTLAEHGCHDCVTRVPRPRIHPDLEPGTVIGRLTVIKNGYRMRVHGKRAMRERAVFVQCSCGSQPYWVSFCNIIHGKTTHCPQCETIRGEIQRVLQELRDVQAGYKKGK